MTFWKDVTRIGASAAIVLLLIAGTALGQVQYAITDLGTLGGTDSEAYGINNNGQVVGLAYLTGDRIYHAFLCNGSSPMQDIGTLGGNESCAFGINTKGQVVGFSSLSGDSDYHPFLYNPSGSIQDLGTLNAHDDWNFATAINNSGQVVGGPQFETANWGGGGGGHAFLFSGTGPMQDLGTLNGDLESFATGINDSGQIVGFDPYYSANGFLYTGGTMQDLGHSVFPTAINNAGEIVGHFSIVANGEHVATHAFKYTGNGPIQDLGTLVADIRQLSYARAVNSSGQIVGEATAGANQRAFLYSNGTMTNLNNLIAPSSGLTLIAANGINDKGQIVGYGNNPAGQIHAFLLSPLSTITKITGAPPSTLSSTLKPIDPNSTPPSGKLKRWDASSWQAITSWNDPKIRTDQPTVVIVHGWKTGDGDSDFFSSDSKVSSLAKAFYLQSSSANILAWDWQSQAVSNPGGPLLSTYDDVHQEGLDGAAASATRGAIQGISLAQELKALGICNTNLQLIGHSNGGAVIGMAATELALKGQKVKRLTCLDTPKLTLQDIPQADLILGGGSYGVNPGLLSLLATFVDATKYIDPTSASQVEMYYSDGFWGREAFGFGSPLVKASASNVFNGRIYPGGTITSAAQAGNCDHLRIIDWYHDVPSRLPGDNEFVAGINWCILCAGSDQWKAGNYTEQGYDSKVFGTTTVPVQDVVSPVIKAVDSFETGTKWFGQHVEMFMREVGNFAVRIVSGSDGYLWRDVSIPQDASYLTFDLKVEAAGDGDFLTVTLGNQIIYYKSLNATNSNFWTVDPIFIGQFSGQTEPLLFTLNHVGNATPSVLLDNITFSAMLDYAWTNNNGTVTITDYPGFGAVLVIPSTINGLPVTSIGANAFENCINLSIIGIPASVKNIGEAAFYGCTNLTSVYFSGNAPTLGGSSVFAGDSNVVVYYLPGTTGWDTFTGPSPILWNPQIMADANFGVRTNAFGFKMAGTSNLVVVVEACTNLLNSIWNPVSTNTLIRGGSFFRDPQSTNYPVRFYRIHSPW